MMGRAREVCCDGGTGVKSVRIERIYPAVSVLVAVVGVRPCHGQLGRDRLRWRLCHQALGLYRYFHVGFFADLYLTHKPMEQVVLNRLVRRIDRRRSRIVTWSWTHRKRCDALVADWRIYLTSV